MDHCPAPIGLGGRDSIESDGIARIALYGKGGIGKSTVASNVSAALADAGYRVMQIGCDPKADSTRLLTGGERIGTVLERMDPEPSGLEDISSVGYGGVLCVECGGPRPGTGCAGRGIMVALETLDRLGATESFKPDAIIYDVLGDVVCGGFAMPIRSGYARDVFIVTSGEAMSLYAAGNIASAVRDLGESGYARLSGVVQNSKGISGEDGLVAAAAAGMGADVVARILRSQTVQDCEAEGVTVVEGRPRSEQAEAYRSLSKTILERAAPSRGDS
ncbi:MAG: AAA family ATPase [Candidatus Methanoplasma sp.]|jgi:nitrogenase iron protein NifH|nr:AAA family ATPase [Candidatus Methanoplasma sp.]